MFSMVTFTSARGTVPNTNGRGHGRLLPSILTDGITLRWSLRDTKNAVEDDKFELWLDGEKVASEPGGQLNAHADDIGIAHYQYKTQFSTMTMVQGTNIHYFGGTIDEVIVYNSAFDADDFAEYADVIQAAASVEPKNKFTTTWGTLKTQRTGMQ